MVVDDVWLYWFEGNACSPSYAVKKIPKGGGNAAQIATGKGWVSAMAQDEHCVYWTNPEANTIETAAKVQ
jgi:hypothetical protein